ncbi:benzyl alcohol O-benzoyltransferase-like [Gossypium australe]|uniref:Benzyl alcohol O-benzoyltransferase-like n=1 Tax=Gossypium australe TaxID=47621 RepID=A0A5B6WX60_9ROSI|nr:benzyl alcohol O-benzoyltransferase-like [Gossypium australe]
MSDATGLAQFMVALGEMARGVATHLISPVWGRHILDARHQARITFTHREYDEVEAPVTTPFTILPFDIPVQRSFSFGFEEVSLLRSLLPPHLRCCTTFELITACLWRCRTLAINLDPDEEVRMLCVVNARSKFNPSFPSGYYGNVIVLPAAVTTVKRLREKPLGYAVELIKQAKASVTEEYVKSVAALMVAQGKRLYFSNVIGTYIISDLTKIKLEDTDFGWGKAMFAGPPIAVGVVSFLIPTKNKKGEVGRVAPVCLPAPAMERFAKELDMLKHQASEDDGEVSMTGQDPGLFRFGARAVDKALGFGDLSLQYAPLQLQGDETSNFDLLHGHIRKIRFAMVDLIRPTATSLGDKICNLEIRLTLRIVHQGSITDMLGPELVAETEDKVKVIRARLKEASHRQKSYVDLKRRDIEFAVGDKVFLKVSPWKKVLRFGQKGKLSLRFIRLYTVLRRVGLVAYQLELPAELSQIHNVFHVSVLRRYRSDPSHVVPVEEIEVISDLSFEEEPVLILDRDVKEVSSLGESIMAKPWYGGGYVGIGGCDAVAIPSTPLTKEGVLGFEQQELHFLLILFHATSKEEPKPLTSLRGTERWCLVAETVSKEGGRQRFGISLVLRSFGISLRSTNSQPLKPVVRPCEHERGLQIKEAGWLGGLHDLHVLLMSCVSVCTIGLGIYTLSLGDSPLPLYFADEA